MSLDDLHTETAEYPLHDAARENDLAALERALASTPIDALDQYKLTALHWACDRAQPDAVAWLLAHGADANAVERRLFKRRPLHFAALGDASSSSIVSMLLAHGADLEATDHYGRAALHCAAHSGNIPVLSCLLEHEANARATTSMGQTVLHVAAVNGQSPAVAFLGERLPDIVAFVDANGRTAMDLGAVWLPRSATESNGHQY
ncbi:hypothetical protein SPRG_08245 [Saprolegnia parasitica CBS 223.65]|uniref:Uncharacterized protein n=1 Tax=Saprolegnia parasitica (strain CBS 223.65) TaxID=695850 RepID=A0A067CI03_SAPPC|nr:hypothetical protein SPRG_08245 [Saprolegnia parasitica CBS 223.65]KDO26442.1 hypothetical protein SPRG_08245 [Saprolegnia parasitica CBS 223.65]|eukprot:XP_012202878.1 hypothetical protein SPRG_08245 [Saprolegnia parasitica CBS 223.65]